MDGLQAKVLIAEDNIALANILKFNLERAGLCVTVAHTGLAAIEAVARCSFDLVITDYQMPGANGEQVCQAVRASARGGQTALVLCTAKCYELDDQRLKDEFGLAAVLVKPFSPLAVIRLVKELITPALA
jgi:CheY-like chemotaxis protein